MDLFSFKLFLVAYIMTACNRCEFLAWPSIKSWPGRRQVLHNSSSFCQFNARLFGCSFAITIQEVFCKNNAIRIYHRRYIRISVEKDQRAGQRQADVHTCRESRMEQAIMSKPRKKYITFLTTECGWYYHSMINCWLVALWKNNSTTQSEHMVAVFWISV